MDPKKAAAAPAAKEEKAESAGKKSIGGAKKAAKVDEPTLYNVEIAQTVATAAQSVTPRGQAFR